MADTLTCKNCGNTFEGKYCNACGEKFYTDHDKSVKHLFEEAFHFITHFDSKFFITLKAVLFKTGQFSKDYTEGKRKKYFKPISLFLIVVVLYLIFPLFKGLNMKFSTYDNPQFGYTYFVNPVIKSKLNHGVTLVELAQHYDEKSPKFAKVLLLLYLPLMALVLAGLFFNKRRYFFDHFVLATELTTFFVFFTFLFLPLVMVLFLLIYPPSVVYFSDSGYLFKIVGVFFVFITAFAFRRFYNEGRLLTVLKALIAVAMYIFVIKYIYSLILFYIVMLFVH